MTGRPEGRFERWRRLRRDRRREIRGRSRPDPGPFRGGSGVAVLPPVSAPKDRLPPSAAVAPPADPPEPGVPAMNLLHHDDYEPLPPPHQKKEEAMKLGTKARDVISGWEGTLVARHEYLNGCVRYEIAGADKDGKPEEFVFDEQQIEHLGDGPLAGFNPTPTGGPRDNRPVPRR